MVRVKERDREGEGERGWGRRREALREKERVGKREGESR